MSDLRITLSKVSRINNSLQQMQLGYVLQATMNSSRFIFEKLAAAQDSVRVVMKNVTLLLFQLWHHVVPHKQASVTVVHPV